MRVHDFNSIEKVGMIIPSSTVECHKPFLSTANRMKSIVIVLVLTTLYVLARTARRSSAVYSWLDTLDNTEGTEATEAASNERQSITKKSKLYFSLFSLACIISSCF